MTTDNSTPPDMIAQAGALLKMLQDGDPIGNVTCLGDDPDSDDRTIVIASAVLAVAGELRELRNMLADGLLSQLAELDADNALLIDRLRRSAAHDGEATL